VFAWFWPEVADTANYRNVAETLQYGGQLYIDTGGIYPYPPLWSLIELAALLLSQHTGVPFVFLVKLLPILFVAILALVAIYNYAWPEIIYGTPLRVLPPSLGLGLWMVCTATWWLWVVGWLTQQGLKVARSIK
jgi:hypothetical protein